MHVQEFRERVEVADFVDKFDLQFVDSPVSLGTPSGKPVKEDLTLDDLPVSAGLLLSNFPHFPSKLLVAVSRSIAF